MSEERMFGLNAKKSVSPLSAAIEHLRSEGHNVQPADWGLVLVNGHELTVNQVIYIALHGNAPT